MNEIELKECPFCGGIAFLVQRGTHAECLTPGCCVGPLGLDSWNRRSPQWQPIETLDSDEVVITWHDFGGVNQNTASPHFGKTGYSRIQQRFGGRLFPSEACETGFVTHWQPLPAPPEVSP